MAGKTKSCLAQDVLSLFTNIYIYSGEKRQKQKETDVLSHIRKCVT